jgi:hypothetical protein
VGTLTEWDPETFSNVVRYRGAELRNLAVMNGIEALSFEPGITVSLLGMSGTGVLTSWAILGRYIVPGGTATEEAIQSLQSNVAKEISAEIFAERIFTAEDASLGSRTPGTTPGWESFGDLSGTDPGPSVSVDIGPAGTMLITTTAVISVGVYNNAAFPGTGGVISFALSGANTASPDIGHGPSVVSTGVVSSTLLTDSANMVSVFLHFSTTEVVRGLNPGLTTVTARYAVYGGNPRPVLFSARKLVVIAF